jgi:hypothetical protein
MFERVLEREVEWGGRTIISQVYRIINSLHAQTRNQRIWWRDYRRN